MMKKISGGLALTLLAICSTSNLVFAQDSVAAPPISAGDTAWVLISAALVMLMTPGLAYFYGGMVQSKNVVSTLFKNFSAIAIVGVLWVVCGYSLAFAPSNGGIIGGLNWLFLNGVGQEAFSDYSATIPHLAFMIFQCMFAIITPALIIGAIVERVRFSAWLVFMAVWSLIVYSPVAHWVWGVGGWIRSMGSLDFAGGMVVHMTAGYSALVAAALVGHRKVAHSEVKPFSSGYVMLGTALLWFGWFGFNSGSALGANGLAAHAFVTTMAAASMAFLSWMLLDWFTKGTPSAIGACIGAVAGLVAITPAAGFVSISSSLVIGLIAGVLCNLAATLVKKKIPLDDSLDVFACHGVGGTLGTILTAIFASKAVNGAGADGLIFGSASLLISNLISAFAVIAYSMIMTFVILKVINIIIPLRAEASEEVTGLDTSIHNESIYNHASIGIEEPTYEAKPKKRELEELV
ncbi:MAG: ammonium transporter [Chloroherpetonaceae bacterium]|nr:ammonium transporter [Chloroherpetonaceae bacterium]